MAAKGELSVAQGERTARWPHHMDGNITHPPVLKAAASTFVYFAYHARALSRAGHRENTEVRDALSRAIAWINGKLTPVTYAYIGSVEGDAENAEPADAKSHKRALSTRLRREGRIVPDLIFAIEDYERQLLRLSRAGRLNLTHVAKRATNRDFRVRLN